MISVQKRRPIGITAIAVLSVLGGIVYLIGGLFIMAMPTLMSILNEELSSTVSPIQYAAAESSSNDIPESFLPGIPAEFVSTYGAIVAAMGVTLFVLAYGLFGGKAWAWTLGVVISVVMIAWTIAEAARDPSQEVIIVAISLGISIAILCYLYRPHVRRYFGKIAGTTQQSV